MGIAVQVEGLRKSYGAKTAVADVSFTVAEGEIFGLLGPNGAGKTTTVECLQGLRRPDGGRMEVFGLDPVSDTARVRRIIGSQLQESALPERLKVWEALHLFSTIRPGGPPWRELLDQWGLADRRNTAFGDLSGGQRQRLFVALALVADPKLVLLDEMTTGLDPAARRVAWELVAALRERGTTVVLVTHFMDEAERLCDRLAVVVDGRVAASGSVAEVIASGDRETVVRFSSTLSDTSALAAVPGVTSVAREGRNGIRVEGRGPLLARIAHVLVEMGEEPEDLRVDLPSLEDAYLALTADAGQGSLH